MSFNLKRNDSINNLYHSYLDGKVTETLILNNGEEYTLLLPTTIYHNGHSNKENNISCHEELNALVGNGETIVFYIETDDGSIEVKSKGVISKIEYRTNIDYGYFQYIMSISFEGIEEPLPIGLYEHKLCRIKFGVLVDSA